MSETTQRILKANGEAGEVDVNPDGSANFQWFMALAGPFDPGTPITVMSESEAAEITAEVERLTSLSKAQKQSIIEFDSDVMARDAKIAELEARIAAMLEVGKMIPDWLGSPCQKSLKHYAGGGRGPYRPEDSDPTQGITPEATG